MYQLCETLRQFQTVPYVFASNPDILAVFNGFPYVDEDVLYSLSLQIEPRSSDA